MVNHCDFIMNKVLKSVILCDIVQAKRSVAQVERWGYGVYKNYER